MNAFSSLTITLSILLGAVEAHADAPGRPNLVIIYADDLGYGDLGCFGSTRTVTPNLDKMAREGRKFTNFHVAQAVCSASRTALLTGCYPNRLGIHGALGPKATVGISDNEVTLAQLLKRQGYSTGMAGKWHLGHHPRFLPTRHGFDEYLGLPYSNDMWPHQPGAKNKAGYPALPLIEGETTIDPDVTAEDQARLTSMYTSRAVSFIEKHKKEPFFFYLAHSMPHVPLHASKAFLGKSGKGLYADVIMEIDASVGRILETLDTNGLKENTLVIFTSDNGPWLPYGEHAGTSGPLREGKGTAWEGGIRAPCVMRWPGKMPAGSVCDDFLMTIDVLPTVAALVDARLPKKPIDGLDVGPILLGSLGAKNPHDAYYLYYGVNQLQGIVSGDGRWKLMLPHSYGSLAGKPGGVGGVPAKSQQFTITRPELYDLAKDRSETTDVAERNPEVVKALLEFAERARTDLGDAITKRKGSGLREPGRVEATP